MANRHYRNLANDMADMLNEQNEAYFEVSGTSASNLPANTSPSVPQSASPPSNQGNNSRTNEANNEGSGSTAENAERISGHDEIFDAPVSTDYKCPICITVLRDPVQTPCGHRFCKACINRHMKNNGNTCPIDNQEVDRNVIYADNFAKREINQLKVKCRTLKNKKECPWTGPLQNIEEHLRTCEFVEVPCPKGCNQNVERKSMEHHLKKECSKRTVICQHCKTEVQHKNLKDHQGKCQNVTVVCPNCNKKMLREKLTASHEKECPKALAVCVFKAYGCKWTGLRVSYQSHVTNEASMAAHLSMLCTAIAAILPSNGRKKNKTGSAKSDVNVGASGSGTRNGSVSENVMDELNRARNRNAESIANLEGKIEQIERRYRDLAGRTITSSSSGNGAVSGNVLEELNRTRDRNAESIANLKAKIEQIERSDCDLAGRLERQQRENEASIKLFLNRIIEVLPRMCNGVYLWRITGYARHLENARKKVVIALYSPPFYTNFYGYKLCLSLHLTGVECPALDPEATLIYVSLFVHMMQSDWDDTLEWPFSGRISLSILDHSDDGEHKRHISKTLVTRPNLLAFKRPTTPLSHGYGYVEFTQIETLEDRRYIKNDCLFIRVQVFQ